jgi:hypothetical protein
MAIVFDRLIQDMPALNKKFKMIIAYPTSGHPDHYNFVLYYAKILSSLSS